MRSKATAALVKYRKIVNVEDFGSWTWDALVDAAQKATQMRSEIDEIVKTTYGDYIARLTMAPAVKRGGIKEFCEETGLNYGTVKNWRSRYLSEEQKREYRIREPEPASEPEPEAERIVTVDDNSQDEAEFTDMFNGETRKATELEVDFERGDYSEEDLRAKRITIADFKLDVDPDRRNCIVDIVACDKLIQSYDSEVSINTITIVFDSSEFIVLRKRS